MLKQTLKLEEEEYIQAHTKDKEYFERKTVVRKGYHLKRTIISGIGSISIRQSWADDQKQSTRFTSAILPKYLRLMSSVDKLTPFLYPKSINTNYFS